jgi:uncharacterized protein
MGEHPNLDLMRGTLQAFGAGDVPALYELFAPDVVWHVPGRSLLAKDYRGREEVFAFFARLMQRTNGTFHVESLGMFANDDGGVFVADRVFCRYVARVQRAASGGAR